MVRIDENYLGDLRCEAVHAPSGKRLVTDAPVDNQGRGESFSPTDLVATALGSCIATIMGIYARTNGVSLEGMRFHVEKTMTAQAPRRIARLDVLFEMPAGIDPKARRAFEVCAETCPVRLSLRADIEVPVQFKYPD